MSNKNISQFKSESGEFSWINIIGAQRKELEYLRKKFKFNDLDLKDALASHYAQRPKFIERPGYSFLILQFPFFNAKTRTIEPEEIDFFIGKNYVITTHKNNLPPLVELANLCVSDDFYRNQYLDGNNAAFIYEVISRLLEHCYPILDHLSLDIKNIERNIFAGHERRMVNEILCVKRNVLNFRKIMSEHKNTLRKIIHQSGRYLPIGKLKIYYEDLIEHTKNIWEILGGQKEMIEALEDTNTSLVSFKLNEIMRTLTIFSVIVFPLTLFAAIFGMNTVNGMPFINTPDGFWRIITIMGITSLCMFLFFKRKKWL